MQNEKAILPAQPRACNVDYSGPTDSNESKNSRWIHESHLYNLKRYGVATDMWIKYSCKKDSSTQSYLLPFF